MSLPADKWAGPSLPIYAFWVVMCALAELVGIAVGAAWWVSINMLDPDPVTMGAKVRALLLK